MTHARAAADAVITELEGRSGFDGWWAGIDTGTQIEIRHTLADVITATLTAAPDTIALNLTETSVIDLPPTTSIDVPECPCGRTSGPCICSACSLTTDDALARFTAAFTEWDRRFREEPERFEAESVRLLRGTPETYGDAAAPYFAQIIDEQADKESGR